MEALYDTSPVSNWSPSSMMEVTLESPDDFLKVKETLTRIGVASQNNVLYQSCHILHKQGRYFIVHFKELFLLDGKIADFTMDDLARRNTICLLLSDWGLIGVSDRTKLTPVCTLKNIKVIPFKSKSEWKLETKYSIGKVKQKT